VGASPPLLKYIFFIGFFVLPQFILFLLRQKENELLGATQLADRVSRNRWSVRFPA